MYNSRIEHQFDFLCRNIEIDVAGSWVNKFNARGVFSYSDKFPLAPFNVKLFFNLFNQIANPTIIARKKVFENYLFKEYRGSTVPPKLQNKLINHVTAKLASVIRLNAGQDYTPSYGAEQPLTLYSFESSPFSRLVREKLCELDGLCHPMW